MASLTAQFVLLSLLAMVLTCEAHGNGNWREKFKECKEHKVDDKQLFKGFQTCMQKSKEGGGNGNDGGKKGRRGMDPCFAKCLLMEQGTITSDGKYSESGCESFYEKAGITGDVLGNLIKAMNKCNDQYGSEFNFDDCSSYHKFFHCKKKSYFETCGIPVPKRGGGRKHRKGHNEEED